MLRIIIVAAGSGSRFGSELPKQFVTLGGRPVLLHTLSAFRNAFPGADCTVVLSPDYVDFFTSACSQFGMALPQIVIGGDTRAQSVRNALSAMRFNDGDKVMIHDGARPVVPHDMLRRISDALSGGCEAVIPAIPVTDSLRLVPQTPSLPYSGPSRVTDRSLLLAVQTPQAFDAQIIAEAYRSSFSSALTDDASVYQAHTGKAPTLVEGSPLNIKITHPRDIDIARLYLNL